MFTIVWTSSALSTFKELELKAKASLQKRQKDHKTKSSPVEGLFKQTHKTICLLSENPRHPALNTHQYSSIPNPYRSGEKVFEAYIQNKTPGAYRVFWCYGTQNKEITIIAITPHP